MVPESRLRRRAAELGVGLDAIEREVAALSALKILGTMTDGWVLRGGTALAYGYFDVHRLSEDLDLTTPGAPGDIDTLTTNIADGLSERLGTEVAAVPPAQPLPGPELRRVEMTWDERHRLQIDFAWHERTCRNPTLREILTPYPELGSVTAPMWALDEIMANKWFILDERAEPRDLFDLWFGLTNFHVEWNDLVRCHQERYGFSPVVANLERSGLQANWEGRLGHQIRNLPPFDEVKREVRWHIAFEQDV